LPGGCFRPDSGTAQRPRAASRGRRSRTPDPIQILHLHGVTRGRAVPLNCSGGAIEQGAESRRGNGPSGVAVFVDLIRRHRCLNTWSDFGAKWLGAQWRPCCLLAARISSLNVTWLRSFEPSGRQAHCAVPLRVTGGVAGVSEVLLGAAALPAAMVAPASAGVGLAAGQPRCFFSRCAGGVAPRVAGSAPARLGGGWQVAPATHGSCFHGRVGLCGSGGGRTLPPPAVDRPMSVRAGSKTCGPRPAVSCRPGNVVGLPHRLAAGGRRRCHASAGPVGDAYGTVRLWEVSRPGRPHDARSRHRSRCGWGCRRSSRRLPARPRPGPDTRGRVVHVSPHVFRGPAAACARWVGRSAVTYAERRPRMRPRALMAVSSAVGSVCR
jgi:hypothetical protein